MSALPGTIRIGYANTRGWRREQAEWVKESLGEGGEFDMLVAVETWFHNWTELGGHPLLVKHSAWPEKIDGQRHHGGVAIFARQELLPAIVSTSRGVNWCRVVIGQFDLAGVYFAPSMGDEKIQEALCQIGSEGSSMVVGDFNSRLRSLDPSAGGNRADDRLIRSSLYHAWAATYGYSFIPVAGRPGPLLDHVWSKSESATACIHELSFRSDHPGISADIQTDLSPSKSENASSGEKPFRYRIGQLDIADNRKLLLDCYNLISPAITRVLRRCSNEAERATTDGETRQCVDYADGILTAALEEVSERVLGVYFPAEKRQQPDYLAPTLQRQSGTLATVRAWKRGQRANRVQMGVSVEGRKRGFDSVQETENHLSTVWGADEETDLSAHHLHTLTRPEDSPLATFSIADLENLLKKMSNSKSPGYDNTHPRILRTLLGEEGIPCSFSSHLHELFMLCARAAYFPKRWGRALVVLIPKDRSKVPTASTCRPISLLPVFRRVFEKALLKSLQKTKPSWIGLHWAQAGFRNEYSCQTNLLTIDYLARFSEKKLHCFLDFKQAYDRPPFDLVIEELRHKGCSGPWLAILASFLNSGSSAVAVVNNAVTKPFRRGRGLPQGAPLSPFLFNLYIDSLVTALNRGAEPKAPTSLFFADDGTINVENEKIGQELLDVAERWADQHGMEYNVQKCAVVSAEPARLYLSGQLVPQVEQYKYLGAPFRVEGGLDMFEWANAQVERLQKGLKTLQARAGLAGPAARLALYKTFVAPYLDYGRALLHLKILELPTKRARNHILAPLEAHWREVVCWTADNIDRRHFRAAASMSGLVSFEERLESSMPAFQRHIAVSAHRDSPARALLSLPNPPKGTMYDIVRGLARIKQFHEAKSRSGREQPISLETFTKNKRKEWLRNELNVGKLGTFILRRRVNLSDACFSLGNTYQTKLAIRWRANAFNVGGECFCGEPFQRTHVDRCFDPLVERLIAEETDHSMREVMERKEVEVLERDLNESYTVIDCLLNSEDDWYCGVKILHKIREWSKGAIWISRIDGWDNEVMEDSELGERERSEARRYLPV